MGRYGPSIVYTIAILRRSMIRTTHHGKVLPRAMGQIRLGFEGTTRCLKSTSLILYISTVRSISPISVRAHIYKPWPPTHVAIGPTSPTGPRGFKSPYPTKMSCVQRAGVSSMDITGGNFQQTMFAQRDAEGNTLSGLITFECCFSCCLGWTSHQLVPFNSSGARRGRHGIQKAHAAELSTSMASSGISQP